MAFNNDPVTASLTMDRSTPIGNSPATDQRGRLHTKVSNSASEAIPVYITSAVSGSVVNIFNQTTGVISGSETVIVSYTVPILKALSLNLCQFSGNNIALFNIYQDTTLIATYRTMFGTSLTGELNFSGLTFAAGTMIIIKVLQNRPSSGDFEGRIIGVLNDV